MSQSKNHLLAAAYVAFVVLAIAVGLLAPRSPVNAQSSNGNKSSNGACGTCALTTGGLNQFASTTSAQLAGVLSDEIGSGKVVFATALQGTDANQLTSGTVSGTGAALCTDAQGGATTSGCTSGGVTSTAMTGIWLCSDWSGTDFTPLSGALISTSFFGCTATELNTGQVFSQAGHITAMYVFLSQVVPGAKSVAVTIRKATPPAAASDTTVTCTIAATGQTCNITGQNVAFAAGDSLDVKVVGTAALGLTNALLTVGVSVIN